MPSTSRARTVASIWATPRHSIHPRKAYPLARPPCSLEPEKTRNFELGTKWDVMGGRLSLSTAGFRTEKTNARTPGINPGDPPTGAGR